MNEASAPAWAIRSPPDATAAEWIRANAIPLVTVEPGQAFEDLAALRTIIGDAQIVSLGEATHGTREFFKLKQRLLEYCVAELGFTMLIMEAGFPEAVAVNDYVLKGRGNAIDALAGMRFWTWQTEELVDVTEWMRAWNAAHDKKVKFYGFTMAYPASAVHGLIDFLARVAPHLAATCRTQLAPLTSDLTAALFGQLPQAERDDVFACIARILAAFEEQRVSWVALTSDLDWHLGRLHAVVLDQGARFMINRDLAFHERATAQNICSLLEAEGSNARAVLWSHNTHAARGAYPEGQSMGRCLDDVFGRRQVVVGTSFDRGAFQARIYPTGVLQDHTLGPAPSDSLDGVLAQTGLPLYVIDLANGPRQGAAAEWLDAETPMRAIGGIYGLPEDNPYGASYTEKVIPRAHFDALVFVSETTAARRNRDIRPRPKSPVLPNPTNVALAGERVPMGWHVEADGQNHHQVAICNARTPSNGGTVRIDRDAPRRWGQVSLVQKISAQAYRGRRLRFSAAVRTRVVEVGAGALLFVRCLPIGNDGVSDFFAAPLSTAVSDAAPVQSPQWTTCAVEAMIPESAACFVIGFILTGNGTAWFADTQLTSGEPLTLPG